MIIALGSITIAPAKANDPDSTPTIPGVDHVELVPGFSGTFTLRVRDVEFNWDEVRRLLHNPTLGRDPRNRRQRKILKLTPRGTYRPRGTGIVLHEPRGSE